MHFETRLAAGALGRFASEFTTLSFTAVLAATLALSGCSDAEPIGPSGQSNPSGTGKTCEVGVPFPDGSCITAGVPADQCAAGFLPDGKQGCEPILPPGDCPDGTMPMIGQTECQPVGVSAGAGLQCGPVLEPDGNGGCNAILPTNDCAAGLMAAPGETECHEPQACGTGTWGDIPVDAGTQYVDASYSGGNSDGSSAKPWTTIADGLSHADVGAVVAVAAGTYPENLSISKGVKLWGVCPSKVNLTGALDGVATITVSTTPQGQSVEAHGLGITGSGNGVEVNGATAVTLAGLWVHDLSGDAIGLHVTSDTTMSEVTLQGSLIEGARREGVFVEAAKATIDASVIRGTMGKSSDGNAGYGVAVSDVVGEPGELVLTRTLLDQNQRAGLLISGGNATVDGLVSRNTLPTFADNSKGFGLCVQDDQGVRSTMVLKNSLLDNNHAAGLLVLGSDANVSHTVIRNTQPQASDKTYGCGIQVGPRNELEATLTVASSLIEKNFNSGILEIGADATVDETIIRDTLPQVSDGLQGNGIFVQDDTGIPATLHLRNSRLEKNRNYGLLVIGASAEVESTVVRGREEQVSAQTAGWVSGVEAAFDSATGLKSNLSLTASLVEKNNYRGVEVDDSDATIENCVVRDVHPSPSEQETGAGISAFGTIQATLTVRSTLVENANTGLFVSGANAQVEASVIRRSQISPTDGVNGVGVSVQPNNSGLTGNLTLSGSLLDANPGIGLAVVGGRAMVANTLIRNLLPPDSENAYGEGVSVEAFNDTTVSPAVSYPGSLSISSSLIDGAYDSGLQVVSPGTTETLSEATVKNTLIRNVKSNATTGKYGDGVAAYLATLSIEDSIFENNGRTSLANFGSKVVLRRNAAICSPILYDQELVDVDIFTNEPIDRVDAMFDQHDSVCADCDGSSLRCTAVSENLEPPEPLPPITAPTLP